VFVKKTDTYASEKKGVFNRSQFKYDKENDIYICPAGNELKYGYTTCEKGLNLRMYYSCAACSVCEIRSQCTKSKRDPRRMSRWEHEDGIEEMLEKLKAKKDAMLIRKQTVEHPFGTIKLWMGSAHFLTKRFKNVGTEMDLHVLAYNLKRMINIVGVNALIAAM